MAFNSSSFLPFIAAISTLFFIDLQLTSFSHPTCYIKPPHHSVPVAKEDIDLMQFPENLEFMEAEWFLWGGLGYGLDVVKPELTGGGPPPIGVKKAKLDHLVNRIVVEFGYQEVGHLRLLISSSIHFLQEKLSFDCFL